eukprot:g4692.t1
MPTGSSRSTVGDVEGSVGSSSEFPWLDDFPELHITNRDDELLNSLLKETGWGERNKAKRDGDHVSLPIEWVVDIADKDGDWFIGTATGYNDAKQTLHVMVPDRDAPTWTGDVAVNPLTVRLLECCDCRTLALFKQLVRESALEVDWDVSLERRSGRSTRPKAKANVDESNAGRGAEPATREAVGSEKRASSVAMAVEAAADAAATSQRGTEHATLPGVELPPTASAVETVTDPEKEKAAENATGTDITDARATLLLPLGNLVVVEVEGCRGHGSAVTAPCAFAVDGSNRGSGDDSGVPAAVSGDAARRLVRLDDRVEILHCRGTGDSGEEAFYRVAEEGLVSYDPGKINWRAFKRKAKLRRHDERRRGSLAPSSSSAIEALTAPLGHGGDGGRGGDASLLEGVGKEEDGAALMEQVDEANVGVLDERSARDRERITMDAGSLESLIFAVAGRLKLVYPAVTPPPPPPPQGTDDAGDKPNPDRGSAPTGGTEAEPVLPPALDVAVSPIADAASGS